MLTVCPGGTCLPENSYKNNTNSSLSIDKKPGIFIHRVVQPELPVLLPHSFPQATFAAVSPKTCLNRFKITYRDMLLTSCSHTFGPASAAASSSTDSYEPLQPHAPAGVAISLGVQTARCAHAYRDGRRSARMHAKIVRPIDTQRS